MLAIKKTFTSTLYIQFLLHFGVPTPHSRLAGGLSAQYLISLRRSGGGIIILQLINNLRLPHVQQRELSRRDP